jgi:DNA processing protein
MEAARTIRPDDGHYPHALARRADAPAELRLRGTLGPERCPRVAVVGTRLPDEYGTELARRIAFGLARAGVSVISGGAMGVDAAAHKGALDAGGHTVAVLGSGLDRPHPLTNRQLFARILDEGGALVSELGDAMEARRWTFPDRNRIVSGMSDAVVVVRAAAKSGALITADWARRQGVPVFAVPGDVDDPLSAGPLALLRTGARVAAAAEDVLGALGLAAAAAPVQRSLPALGLDAGALALLEALGPRALHADDLARAARLGPAAALAGLLALELEGLCEQRPGHQFVRRA